MRRLAALLLMMGLLVAQGNPFKHAPPPPTATPITMGKPYRTVRPATPKPTTAPTMAPTTAPTPQREATPMPTYLTMVAPTPSGSVPGQPQNIQAVPGVSAATVSWTALPTATSYLISASGGATWIATQSPAVLTGLANGTAYTFTVKGQNNVGQGTASVASNAVTPTTYDTFMPGASGVYPGMWGAGWLNSTSASSGTSPINPADVSLKPNGDTSLTAITDYETDTGHQVAIAHFWRDWNTGTGGSAWIPTAFMNALYARHTLPLITISPTYFSGTASPAITLTSITAGSYDSVITAQAQALRDYRHPVLVRMMHEFNGNWYPNWSVNPSNPTYSWTPAQYIAAWRHIVDIYHSVGAYNVGFVWCPNIWYASSLAKDPMTQYPGDAYVDWIGLDGYNKDAAGTTWDSFSAIFGYAYSELIGLTSKPIMVAETGTSPAYGAQAQSKAAWVTDAYGSSGVLGMPQIRSIVLFNEDKRVENPGSTNPLEGAWPLTIDRGGDPSATSAMSTALSNASYHTSFP
jgi:hypothetical protein